ncbi:MAG: hypothetical protein QOI73_387, partial [Solirubrobacteraceae bacterium]|nr:hypothetical protein [Solirubrobacteraceae bacterium]
MRDFLQCLMASRRAPTLNVVRAPCLVVPAVSMTLLLFAVAPAPSIAGAAPGAAISGGARYASDVPAPAKRPVISQLLVAPREVVAGDPLPRLRFRVRQRGVEQVRARIVVLRLPRRAPVARITLGWVKTGQAIAVRWPAGVALRA